MSNTDPEAIPKEKKTKKAVTTTPSTTESNSETTPTQEVFSISNQPAAHAPTQTNATLPLITPLPPSSEDTDEPMLSPNTSPIPLMSRTHSGAGTMKTPQSKTLNTLGKIPNKTLKLQGEILKGVMTLDNGLKLTSTPLGGFHVPQLGDSVWRNIAPSLQVKATDIIISPPTADETLYERFSQPWHLLVSGLPAEAIDLLTSLAVCTTTDVTCFFIPFEQPLPTYICTIENMTFQDSTRKVSNFINSHILAPTATTASRAIDSTQVSSLNIATSRSSMLTVWKIYCDAPPPFSLEDYYLWSALIRGLRFPSDDYGTSVPHLQDKQFTCTGCKSLDHPTGLCPLPATPGWLGPSNATAKEDLSMTSLDTHSNNPSNNSFKRGSNRGRGTRGRGILRLDTYNQSAANTNQKTTTVQIKGLGTGSLGPGGGQGFATNCSPDDRTEGNNGDGDLATNPPLSTGPYIQTTDTLSQGQPARPSNIEGPNRSPRPILQSGHATTQAGTDQSRSNPQPDTYQSPQGGRTNDHHANTPQAGPGNNAHKKHQAKGKKLRANIKVASLNMRGRWHNGSDEWSSINQIIKDQKLGILALQETHLSKEDETILKSTPRLCIHVKLSIDPAHTNVKGVAIVMNKNLVNTSGVKTHDLIPGRALLVIIPWRKDDSLRILAIYAPNDPQTNQYFWDHLHSKLRGLPKPNIMLGDFNLVEDALDRLPPKQDSQGTTLKLNELKTHLKLRDRWQSEHPDLLQFTFAQSAHQGSRQSRIDRIYIKDELLPFSREWTISAPGIHTDHQLISARILSKKMPFVGMGRWSLPLFILKNKKLREDVIELGKILQ
ncbi:hypothetical protein EV702DRAFT_1201280 [Suillus placidus]|uniref:Endonuclease/exonuclease/phosphatase domain-containing protein n=1 Tax=Suillus placidus TaxID=48579 RepID=A0A9P7CZL1_9AGAM|nr:hypothetical protein EV702DRAFT_1201280 [Suillus placidus]